MAKLDVANRTCRIEQGRPSAVDNSTSVHFPPVGGQELGDCTCWSSGYYYSTYTQARDELLNAASGSGGLSDEEFGTDPCYDNPPHPEIYFHEDRARYSPRLYAVAEVAYAERNRLTFSGGVGAATSPLFRGPSVIEPTEQGDLPIDGPLVVDLTDGAGFIPSCGSRGVFVSLAVSSSAPASVTATIRRVTVHHDLDGDGSFAAISATNLPLTVQRDSTRSVSVNVPGLCP